LKLPTYFESQFKDSSLAKNKKPVSDKIKFVRDLVFSQSAESNFERTRLFLRFILIILNLLAANNFFLKIIFFVFNLK
jgi:hypothetical protein